MKYLFGDGTESSLSFNYLDYLRAALGFSSSVLKGEANVEARRLEADQARARAAEELGQLDEIGSKLDRALEDIGKDTSSPGASGCVENLGIVTKSEIERAKSSIESNLSSELQRLSAIIAGERAANEPRLEKLLTDNDLPESTRWVDVHIDDNRKLQATLEGRSELEVDYSVSLSIPENHLFSRQLRVDKIDPELIVKVPKSAGWGRKGVKLRTFKLAKEFVVGLRHIDGGALLELRNAPTNGHSGYDLTYGDDGVTVTRISKQKPGEPFLSDGEDASKLSELFNRIKSAADDLAKSRHSLKFVTFNGIPLKEHEEPSKLVHILVARMIPIVRQIKERSLSRGELVLKRVLGDDRREEIFASIVDLSSILDGLSDEKRALFAPLGFDTYVDTKPQEEQLDDDLLVEELDDDSLLEVTDDQIDEVLNPGLSSPPKRSSAPPPFRHSSPPPAAGRTSSLPRPSGPPPTPSSPPPRPSSVQKPKKS